MGLRSISANDCYGDNAAIEIFIFALVLDLDLDEGREVLISCQRLQRDLAFWIEGLTSESTSTQRWTRLVQSITSSSSSLSLESAR